MCEADNNRVKRTTTMQRGPQQHDMMRRIVMWCEEENNSAIGKGEQQCGTNRRVAT